MLASYSYQWLSSFFKEPLPKAEEVADFLNRRSFEIEKVRKGETDTIFDISILPDRASYALCHKGVAYELHAIFNTPYHERVLKTPTISHEVSEVRVSVRDGVPATRYIAQRVEGIALPLKADLTEILQRLQSINERSIHPLVDMANYIMFDMGQPLHVFDADKVDGELVIRFASHGEEVLLIGEESPRELGESDVVIADKKGVLAIAGIKGGARAAVTSSTNAVIIESANFDSVAIRKTARRLNLLSDAAKRFENKVNPFRAEKGIDQFISYIHHFFPDARFGSRYDWFPSKPSQVSVKTSLTLFEEVLGISLREEEILGILTQLEMEPRIDNGFVVSNPPPERADVVIAEDIIDEVGRIYGYEHVKGVLPKKEKGDMPLDFHFSYENRLKVFLIQQGFSELYTSSFAPEGVQKLLNPIAKDRAFLRASLKDTLFEAMVRNVHNQDLLGVEAIHAFEIGTVFPKEGEHTSVALAISGIKNNKLNTDSILHQVRGAIENTFSMVLPPIEKESTVKDGILIYKFSLTEAPKEAPLQLEESPDQLLSMLPAGKEGVVYRKPSVYPFVVRDIAIFVPEEVTSSHVSKLIMEHAGVRLQKLYIFDTFKKDDRVSYAFRLIFQDYAKTLSDAEVNDCMGKISQKVEEISGWQVR